VMGRCKSYKEPLLTGDISSWHPCATRNKIFSLLCHRAHRS